MEKILMVDGHSVIHATDWLAEIHENHQESGRLALIRELTEFQNRRGYYVVLVFDGKGFHRGKEGGTEKDVLVLYSKTGESADEVIERLAVKHGMKHAVNVVSNDRLVLDSCAVSGAFGMSVRSMWELIERS